MKQTIYQNWKYQTIDIPTNPSFITTDTIKQNMKTIHQISVQNYLQSRSPNPILQLVPPTINKNEENLCRKTRRTLAQLRCNESPFLMTYLNKINPQTYTSPLCPLCKNHNHDTIHLFNCTHINTNLRPDDLWNDPVAVAELLQLWGTPWGRPEEDLGRGAVL
jgi:hypothetical protein